MLIKHKVKLILSIFMVSFVAVLSATEENKLKLEYGMKPPLLVLNGSTGEKLDGGGWNSNTIGGLVTVVMYVDPDNIDDNLHVEEEIQATFEKGDIKVFGIVNTAATWIPNFMLKRRLSSKQSHNKLLNIILDYKRYAEKTWGLKDERYNVMAFDKDGKLFFVKEGKLNLDELNTLIKDLEKNVVIAKTASS